MTIMFDIDEPDSKKRIELYLDQYNQNPGYEGPDALLMRTISLKTAVTRPNPLSPNSLLASATFTLPILPQFCNPMSNMHGGFTAMLIDMTTTMATAPVASEGFWEFGGVSRTMSITYLGPIVQGSVVEIETNVIGIGKRLSTTLCVVRDQGTGAVLATGEHGKAAIDLQKFLEKRAKL